MTDTIDFAAFRDQLLAREQTLSKDEANGAGSAGIVELDQTRVGRLSRMDALQAQQMAKALNRRRHAERGRIAAALKRMDDGEYGYCRGCGDMIPAGRLRIDPAVTQCVGCATDCEA